MSEDFVNQITLSYLISKTQLQKLNKKMKETTENNRKTDKDIHQEYTDMENHMGYFYCDECKDLLMEGLKNTGIRPIWYIRERFQKQGDQKRRERRCGCAPDC